MILQALFELAEAEGLAKDLDFQELPVAWWIMLKEDGTCVGVEDRRYLPDIEGKKKAKPTAPRVRAPVYIGRTSGVQPQFFVDNAQYIFGQTPPDKAANPNRVEKCFDAFRESIAACSDETNDTGAVAVRRFLDDIAEGNQSVEWNEEWAANDLFAFFLSTEPDKPIHLRPAVVKYWRKQREEAPSGASEAYRCLVTGKLVGELGLFPQVKKVPGGTSSGVAFVSYNASAFLSQGWKGNENGPISRIAAETCSTALQRLVDPAYPDPDQPGTTLPERRYQIGPDTVVVYWSPHPEGREVCNAFNAMVDPEPEKVAESYKSVWRGKRPEVDNPAAFYAMTLSGTQGRIIVRDWLEATVSDVLANLATYFADLAIVRNTPKPKNRDHPPAMPLKVILRGLAVHGDTKRLPPSLAAELFRSALTGKGFPRHLLQRAIERSRAEATLAKSKSEKWLDLERRDARAAIVKAYLNRNRRLNADAANRYPEVKNTMDPTNENAGYLLGRLMALLEKLQSEALGDVNATIVDRYFKRASTTPQNVFNHLLKGANSHLKKLRHANRGRAIFFQKQIDGLLEGLPAVPGLPQRLDLESQGQFLLGYHHQRHWLWMTKEARDEWVETQNESAAH